MFHPETSSSLGTLGSIPRLDRFEELDCSDGHSHTLLGLVSGAAKVWRRQLFALVNQGTDVTGAYKIPADYSNLEFVEITSFSHHSLSIIYTAVYSSK